VLQRDRLRAVFLFVAMRSLYCLPLWVTLGYRSVEGCIMRSSGPQWVALVLAVLALAIITYIAMPPGLIKQATALWGGG
jgi:hypothetical protein